MKGIFTLTFLLCVFCGWCNSDSTLTVEEMKEDLHFLFQNIEATHPNMYANISKTEMEALRSEVEGRIQSKMNQQEFALLINPLMTAIKDGHTGMRLPNAAWKNYLKKGGRFFPFRVKIIDHQLYTAAPFGTDTSMQAYTEILAINGISAQSILQRMAQYSSAELEHFRMIRIQQSFYKLLWFLYDFQGSYELEIKDDSGVHTQQLQGISLEEYKASRAESSTSKTVLPYRYYTLPDAPIGVIDFRSMRNTKAFKCFLDTTFSRIKAEGIEHLVIDIRKNGGGNSQLADLLFDYITDKPYRMVERMDIKCSRQMKKNIRQTKLKWYLMPIAYPLSVFFKQARPYTYGKPGKIYSIQRNDLNKPKNPSSKFKGSTYLLTSHYTFSSANMLATAYSCYQMGTHIGQETGGAYETFGEIQFFDLPHSQLQVYCSSKYFVHACSDGQLHGVVPQYIVPNRVQDLQQGKDAAMEKVKELTGL